MITAWECFHFATLELVRSTPIKQRLVCAYRRYLAALPADEIPTELRDTYAHVMRSLCGVQPLRGEDAVAASVRKMSNQEADECAAQIVEIFGLMCKAQHSPARAGTVVQLHSVDRPAGEFISPALIASN
ncbi:MAG: hypothetical protein ABI356_02495 [Steroidobacteraceae bacterium]